MWNIIDDNTTKLILKRLKNRVNKIAYVGDSIKIFIAGNNMELKKSKTSLKDSLINIINQRFDSMTKESNQRFDEINKQIKDTNKETNERFDKKFDRLEKEVKKDINNLDAKVSNLDIKLNNVIKLNNLKV